MSQYLAIRRSLACLLFAIGVVASSAPAADAQATPTTTPLALIKRAGSAGSCCLVAKTRGKAFWITADHVLRNSSGVITISRPGKKTLIAVPITRRSSADLALVRSSSATVTEDPLPIWRWSLEGQQVWAEGYAGASFNDFGRRSGLFRRLWGAMAEFSLPSIPGESGGPIMTVLKGQKYLASVTSGSDWPRNPRGRQNGYTIGASSSQLSDFLAKSGLLVGPDGFVGSQTLGGRNWPDPGQRIIQPGDT